MRWVRLARFRSSPDATRPRPGLSVRALFDLSTAVVHRAISRGSNAFHLLLRWVDHQKSGNGNSIRRRFSIGENHFFFSIPWPKIMIIKNELITLRGN